MQAIVQLFIWKICSAVILNADWSIGVTLLWLNIERLNLISHAIIDITEKCFFFNFFNNYGRTDDKFVSPIRKYGPACYPPSVIRSSYCNPLLNMVSAFFSLGAYFIDTHG